MKKRQKEEKIRMNDEITLNITFQTEKDSDKYEDGNVREIRRSSEEMKLALPRTEVMEQTWLGLQKSALQLNGLRKLV